MKKTPITIALQGSAEMPSRYAYGLVGDGDALCCTIDLPAFVEIAMSATSESGFPMLYIADDETGKYTVIEFPELAGWRVHAFGQGKAAPLAFVRIAAER